MRRVLQQHRGNRRTTGFFGLGAYSSVPFHPIQELLPAPRVPDVLDPDVYPLLDVTVTDDLVDNNTDSARGDVVDDASSTVVTCKSCVVRSEISGQTHGNICVAYPSAGLRWP